MRLKMNLIGWDTIIDVMGATSFVNENGEHTIRLSCYNWYGEKGHLEDWDVALPCIMNARPYGKRRPGAFYDALEDKLSDVLGVKYKPYKQKLKLAI